ncbi:hypothetical protein COLO4_01703, partial [Corchorus olitorius]
HGGVVASAEQLADLGQALLGQFLGQVHGNLARPGNAGRALLAVHVGDLDLVVVGHRLLDVFHADLAVLDGQQIAQGLAGQLDGDFLLVEARIGQDLAQRAFELAHVGAHVLGHEEGDFLGHLGVLGAGLVDQDGHAHLQLGRLDGHRQPGVEARDQPLVDVGQALGIGVRGHHDVALLGQQGLEGVEELLLRAVLVGEELHIVDQQQIQRVVALLEFVKSAALVGLDHIRDELLGVDVENFRVGLVGQQLVAHGMHQVGLAQAHAAVDEQRVVQVAGRARHMHGGRACHAVGRAFHQGFKGQRGVQARTEDRRCRVFASDRGHRGDNGFRWGRALAGRWANMKYAQRFPVERALTQVSPAGHRATPAWPRCGLHIGRGSSRA